MADNCYSGVGVKSVSFRGGFWADYQKTILEHGIRHQWEALNDRLPDAPESHTVENLRIAAGHSKGSFNGRVFQDSDLSKWIEAAAYLIAVFGDPDLEAIVDDLASMLAKAQGDDGYLNTHFQVAEPDKRWTNLRDRHELYCAGHLIEGAVAYYQATGKGILLGVAERFVEYIDSLFGADDDKTPGYPGHEEIELALVKLWKTTGKQRYLDLAHYFLTERGAEPNFFTIEAEARGDTGTPEHAAGGLAYFQAHAPVQDQKDATGHAVRAMYLYSGMADVARETGDRGLLDSCKILWRSTVDRRMYVTGGIGSQSHGESFTFDHDLSNTHAYTETCAAIGLVFFAHRMLLLERDSRYADAMERALYNGVLSGMSVDGKGFFYVNPLEVRPQAADERSELGHVKYQRQPWYTCACCPPNIARLIASLGGYHYTAGENEVAVHLYAESSATIDLGGQDLHITQETNYPWDGSVKITVSTVIPATFTLALRIPSWCENWSVAVAGSPSGTVPVENGYALVTRDWGAQDTVELELSMPVTRVKGSSGNPYTAGRSAIQRGPLVYCLEEADNEDRLHEIVLPSDAEMTLVPWKGFRSEYMTLDGIGTRQRVSPPDGYPYAAASINATEQKITAIPYFAWANRTAGEMTVWVREA